MQLSSVG